MKNWKLYKITFIDGCGIRTSVLIKATDDVWANAIFHKHYGWYKIWRFEVFEE